MEHPHPDKRFVMKVYRAHILGTKKRFGTARSLVHYKDYVLTYLHCKRIVLGEKK